MDSVGANPDLYTAWATIVMAIAATVTLVVVVRTASYARGQLDEARSLRLSQTRPFVVVSVEVQHQSMFMLVVESVGSVPARNVRVVFDQMPHSSFGKFDELRMLNEPIPTMPPGHRYSAHWVQTFKVFDPNHPYEHPLSYEVRVTYEDQAGHQFGPEEYILDLRVFEGQARFPKGMPDLVKAVEELRQQQTGWSRQGLLVRAADQDARDRRGNRTIVIAEALQAKDEHGWRGMLRYVVDYYREYYGLYERPGWRTKQPRD